jgi:nitrate/nitrite-specific signal transduction histidine kinase
MPKGKINMKSLSIKTLLAMTLVTTLVEAKEAIKTVVPVIKSQKQNLVDMAGKQRMLSQRIVKDYLYKGRKVATAKASKQLSSSTTEFSKALKTLNSSLNDEEIKNLLEFVEMSFNDFKEITKQPFDLDNAQIALDLSESLLEGSQFVVDSIKSSSTISKDKTKSAIIAKSGKHRMLSQRIAKYYIAYQSGIKDKNTVDQMKATVKEFDKNHKELMANKSNSTEINQKLNNVDKLWKIVYKFYNAIEKGGLPFIVFKSTDDITKKMDEITKLYVAQSK